VNLVSPVTDSDILTHVATTHGMGISEGMTIPEAHAFHATRAIHDHHSHGVIVACTRNPTDPVREWARQLWATECLAFNGSDCLPH
jgi:hypothetical protein